MAPVGTVVVDRAEYNPDPKLPAAEVKFTWSLEKLSQYVQGATGVKFVLESGEIQNDEAGVHGPGFWKFQISGSMNMDISAKCKYTSQQTVMALPGQAKLSCSIKSKQPASQYQSKSWCTNVRYDRNLEEEKDEQLWRHVGTHKYRVGKKLPDFWSAKAIIIGFGLSGYELAVVDKYKIPNPQLGAQRLGNSLRESYLSSNNTDFFLVLDDQRRINVHKFVLITNSGVFDLMLQHSLTEKTNVCKVTDVDYDTLKTLIDWFYQVDITDRLATNPEAIFLVADRYQVHELKKRALRLLEGFVDMDNVVDRFLLAKRYNEATVEEKAKKLMKLCWTEFVRNGGLRKVQEKGAQYLDEILRLERRDEKVQEKGVEYVDQIRLLKKLDEVCNPKEYMDEGLADIRRMFFDHLDEIRIAGADEPSPKLESSGKRKRDESDDE